MTTLALAYAFIAGTPVNFDVNVQFEGWIPIFGGREGKANVAMTVVANPLAPTQPGVPVDQIESSITKIEAEAFGVKLPLNNTNVDQFFPKATASFDLHGTVVKNTAPAIKMPAKLPGLDSQRLPEISFLPLSLPKNDLKDGESYVFKRSYGGQEFKYEATVLNQSQQGADFKLILSSVSDGFEDAYGNTLESEKGAKKKSHSVLDGTGTAHFSKKWGCFEVVEVETTETKTIEPISGTAKSITRKLVTRLTIKRQAP